MNLDISTIAIKNNSHVISDNTEIIIINKLLHYRLNKYK